MYWLMWRSLRALIGGFQMVRQRVGLAALAKAEPKALVEVLGPLFEHLLV